MSFTVHQERHKSQKLHKHGLIFAGHHADMILAGKKTQTRRKAMNPVPGTAYRIQARPVRPVALSRLKAHVWHICYQPDSMRLCRVMHVHQGGFMTYLDEPGNTINVNPSDLFLKPGTILYAKEDYRYRHDPLENCLHVEHAGQHTITQPQKGYTAETWTSVKGRHSAFWASRCMMEALDLRVEPLGMITEADAVLEGYSSVDEYRQVWDALHGAGHFQGNLTLLVHVITFRVFTPAEMGVLRHGVLNAGH